MIRHQIHRYIHYNLTKKLDKSTKGFH